MLAALDAGKHVVTANKALLAEAGPALYARARRRGVAVAFEASCAGGIPIIRALYDGLIRAAKTFEDNGRERYITVLSDGGDTTSINTIDAASVPTGAACVCLDTGAYRSDSDIGGTSLGLMLHCVQEQRQVCGSYGFPDFVETSRAPAANLTLSPVTQ